jgi:hypothetical protein
VKKERSTIGELPDPVVRPLSEPVSMADLEGKISALMSAKKDHAKELAAMPGVSGLVDEELERLLLVESVQKRTDSEVLLNMTVRERGQK